MRILRRKHISTNENNLFDANRALVNKKQECSCSFCSSVMTWYSSFRYLGCSVTACIEITPVYTKTTLVFFFAFQIQFTCALILGINGIRTGCEFPLWMHYTLIIYMLSFIVLFGNFYVKAYMEKVKKKINQNLLTLFNCAFVFFSFRENKFSLEWIWVVDKGIHIIKRSDLWKMALVYSKMGRKNTIEDDADFFFRLFVNSRLRCQMFVDRDLPHLLIIYEIKPTESNTKSFNSEAQKTRKFAALY